MRTSLVLPFPPGRPQQAAPVFALAQRARLARVWSGQHYAVESHQLFAYMAGLGLDVPAGMGVTLAPLRHPFEAAIQARSLAAVTGHPAVAGFGAATPEFVAAMTGQAYRSPKEAMGGYVRTVRGYLDREPGPLVLPELTHPGVEVGLGVLRPGLGHVAGAYADVAITWLCPPRYLRDEIMPAVRAGAEEAGRPVPRVVAVVHVALDKEGRDPHQTAFAAAGAHLSSPHYTGMLRRAGVDASPDDPVSGARSLVDSGVFVTGDAAAVAEQLDGYRLAGVDEVVLNATGVALTSGVRAAVAECEAIVEGLAARSSVR